MLYEYLHVEHLTNLCFGLFFHNFHSLITFKFVFMKVYCKFQATL